MLKTLFRTWVRGNVYRKGLSGASPVWTAIGLIGVLRFLRERFSGRDNPPVYARELRSGEQLEIVHTGPPARGLRKDRRREARQVATLDRKLASPRRRTRRAAAKRVAGTRLEDQVDPAALSAARARRRAR